MSKLTRKQHYVPQFLQRNFSIGTDHNKVCIYDNHPNVYIKPSIKLKSIEYNMQADYFYGKSQIGENYLSEIESSASIEIASMIANPKKYMRKHKTLPQSMHNFLSLSVYRGPNGIKMMHDAFCQSRIRQTDLELHETYGKVIAHSDSQLYISTQKHGRIKLSGHHPMPIYLITYYTEYYHLHPI